MISILISVSAVVINAEGPALASTSDVAEDSRSSLVSALDQEPALRFCMPMRLWGSKSGWYVPAERTQVVGVARRGRGKP